VVAGPLLPQAPRAIISPSSIGARNVTLVVIGSPFFETEYRTDKQYSAPPPRAWELIQKGWSQHRIAEALGVTKGAVSQWLSRAKAEGPQALRRRKPPGRRSKLTHHQLQLLELLAQGTQAFGFRGNVWTQPRVAQVIRRHFRRAAQRDEEAIQRWKEERWPALKKGSGGRPDHRLRR
jgi:Homeodomain-like domain-containing protein